MDIPLLGFPNELQYELGINGRYKCEPAPGLCVVVYCNEQQESFVVYEAKELVKHEYHHITGTQYYVVYDLLHVIGVIEHMANVRNMELIE